MTTVAVSCVLPGSVHEAERCWYDTDGWPEWMDEVARVLAVHGPWPATGASVEWQSGPAGRGRVRERVLAYQPLEGQTVQVEDDSIEGEQQVSFTPFGDEVEVRLELRYRIKRRNPFTALVDLIFIRRLMSGSLTRTLTRFDAALAASRQIAGG